MKSPVPSRAAWLAVLFALALRAVVGLVAVRNYSPSVGDPAQYVYIAQSLQSGEGYSLPWLYGGPTRLPAEPTAVRQPAYPLFLAAIFSIFGDHLTAVVLVQALLDTLSCLLLARTARTLFGQAATLPTLWWAALYPELWIHASRIWSEGLFIAFTTGLLYALSREEDRGRPAQLLCGGLLGLLILTRPNGIFFAPVVALSVARHSSAGVRLRAIAGTLMIAAMVMAPWMARNYQRFHRCLPFSSGGGFVVAGAYNDAALDDPAVRGGWIVGEVMPTALRSGDEFEADARLKEKAFRWASSHVRSLPRIFAYRVLGMWWRYGWHPSEVNALRVLPGLAWLEWIAYLPTLAVAATGFWRARLRIRHAAPFIPLTMAAFTLCSCLTWGDWRLRAPIEPVLVLLVGAAFARPSGESIRDRA